jgi:hypothetical protein
MNNQTIQKEIMRNIGELIMLYPQYTASQHLVHFLRSQGDEEKAYSWTNHKLLKKIENYREELANELSERSDEDEDDEDF